jgi:UDP-glucose 4-epimerase
VPHDVPLIRGNIRQKDLVEDTISKFGIDSVIHFAASIVVPDSVERPLDYYENNVANSLHLIEACVASGVQQFIFSSSAAVYGQPEIVPVPEDAPAAPENPYGKTKLVTEWVLRDTAAAHDLRFAALRYFNVAGADSSGEAGQVSHNSTHLIKVACETALGLRPEISIYGTDYPTRDGTCIRDYIHVSDLADIHLLALRRLQDGADSFVLNCGYGRGYSVREVLAAVARVSGGPLSVREVARRPGDPAVLVANTDLLTRRLGWRPQYSGLDKIIETALGWERHMANAAFAIEARRDVQRSAAHD